MKTIQDLLSVSEAVHTIRNDHIKPRGAPEDKARAFDKVNPKTGARPNRSVLNQNSREDFIAIQGEETEDYTMCLVMSPGNSSSRHYYGVNVLFFDDGRIEASTADSLAAKEWKNHKSRIIKVAKAYLKSASRKSPQEIEGPLDESINESVQGNSMDEVIDSVMSLENIHHFEGHSGLVNFTKIVKAIGYHSLMDFLEDNSGALTAMVEWIKDQNNQEWMEHAVGANELSVDDIVEKIASNTGITVRAAYAIFVGGSAPGTESAVQKLEDAGYDSAGAWAENKDWFESIDVTKQEYDALVQASL